MQYENLEVWVRSKQLCVNVYTHFANSRDFGFKDQITRSALSICSNIAEGMEYSTKKEKTRYLQISKASCGEFKTQTIIGMEIGYINKTIGENWLAESETLGRMLGGFIRSLKSDPVTRNP